MSVQQLQNYIAGEWVAGATTAKDINPSDTSDVVAEYAQADKAQTETAIAAARAADGQTPLHQAARGGHGGIAERLLKRGAPVNAADAAGLTPLMLAATGGHAEAVTLLLAWGADVNLKAGSGATALNAAQRGGHAGVEELLRAVGARE